jgi:hypothetical protein
MSKNITATKILKCDLSETPEKINDLKFAIFFAPTWDGGTLRVVGAEYTKLFPWYCELRLGIGCSELGPEIVYGLTPSTLALAPPTKVGRQ